MSHHTRRGKRILFLIIFASLTGALHGTPAHGAGEVTDCSTYGATGTPGVFLPGTLGASLVGGGDVTFACSGTIVVPTINVTVNTRIDATGQSVALSGNNTNNVLQPQRGSRLELIHLTITQGGGGFSAIRNLGANVTLQSCTVSGNTSSSNAGAIHNNDSGDYPATMTIIDSTISDNRSTSGGAGAITNYSTMRIERSTVSRNTATSSGGISNQSGNLTFVDSTLSDNSAGTTAGLSNYGKVTFINSTIARNVTTSGRTGGIYNHSAGEVSLTNSVVTGNSATTDGGIWSSGTFNIIDSTISNNIARTGFAGGISNLGGVMTITNSTIFGNSAATQGGGIVNSTPNADSQLTITNSTISGNTAGTDGGGIYNYSRLNLAHVTFSGNSATRAGGLYQVGGSTVDDLIYTSSANTIIADSPMGGNCYPTKDLIRDLGYNVSDDDSCHLTSETSLPGVDPLLGPLAENGGHTQTHALLPGSPAIDLILEGTNDCGTVITRDQRGIERPQGAGCDAGAYEFKVLPEEEIHLKLKKGFSLVALPSDVSQIPDLKDWLPLLGDAAQIEKVLAYDRTARQMVTLIPGSASNPSFAVHPREGLMVYTRQAREMDFTSLHCSTIDLQQGFNLTGIPCPPDGTTAFQVLSALGAARAVSLQRYNTETGAFETAGFDSDSQTVGHNFSIVGGEGYFIFMKQAVSGFAFQ